MLLRDEVRMLWMAWIVLIPFRTPFCGNTLASHQVSGTFDDIPALTSSVWFFFCGLAWGVWEWDGSKEPGTFCCLGLVHLRATRYDDKIPLGRDST
jgi:hypothetical protein